VGKAARPDVDGLDVPLGGVVVRRHVVGQPGSAGPGEIPEDGVLVVARRDAPGVAASADAAAAASTAPNAAHDAQPAALVEISGAAKTTDRDTPPPLFKPSDHAVACVTRVLELIRERDDCKDVMRKLHVDGLVCLARLHGGQAVEGVIAASSVETDWARVRTLLKTWWPSWSIPSGSQPMAPIPGTTAAVLNPLRRAQSSNWVISVDMAAMHVAIRQWSGKAERYFKVKELTSTVDVVRMAPSLKPPMATTIASMLLVGTWDPAFCSLVTQLATAGRARTPRAAPLEIAACHNFEAADVSEPAILRSRRAANGAAAMTAPLPPAPGQRSQGELMAERQAEIDALLAADKTINATASRARRIDARRRQSTASGSGVHGSSGVGRARPRAAPSRRKTGAPPSSSHSRFGATHVGAALERRGGTSRAVDALSVSQVTAVLPHPDKVVSSLDPGPVESSFVGASASAVCPPRPELSPDASSSLFTSLPNADVPSMDSEEEDGSDGTK